MTALGKLLRTTAFKLTLVYLTVFALFAAFLLGYFAWNTRRLITEQITQTVDAEITGLAEQYRLGGIRRLVFVIDARARRPGSSLYLVTTPAGEGLAGNVGSLSTGILETSGWTETVYRRLDDQDAAEHHALVRVFQLPGGFRLLVGRDLEERERLHDIVLAAGRWSLAIVVVLGVAGGFFVTRRVLKRVDAMTDTTRTIMDGDLTGRLPIAGTGDELDRLAENLNAMLERIEALMHGLKEVSDNIAHDLKTPLTRLRNRCEEALRLAEDESQYRAALESTIEESDGADPHLQRAADDRAGRVRPGARQYERLRCRRNRARRRRALRAAGRRQGLKLRVEAPAAATVHGNRELVSQALANLVDNAIKYAAPNGVGSNGATAPRSWSRRRAMATASAHGGGRRSRHPGGRSRPRGRALRAAGTEPLRAGLRARAQPRIGGCPAARRRACGSRTISPACAASSCCRASGPGRRRRRPRHDG